MDLSILYPIYIREHKKPKVHQTESTLRVSTRGRGSKDDRGSADWRGRGVLLCQTPVAQGGDRRVASGGTAVARALRRPIRARPLPPAAFLHPQPPREASPAPAERLALEALEAGQGGA